MSSSSGKLEPLKLFKVFRSVLERRLGGTLTVRRGQVAKQARLAFGHVIAAASNRPEESLARALVEEGLISSTERVEIDAARRADRRSFEAHVRERGLVAEARLESIERRLARLRLLECFAWPDGTFEFKAASVRTPPGKTPIDTVELLLEASARKLPTPVCERFLAGFARQHMRPTDRMESHGAFFDTLFAAPNLRGLLQTPLAVEGVGSMPGEKARNLREGAAMVLAGLVALEAAGAARAVSGSRRTTTGAQRPAGSSPDTTTGPRLTPAAPRPPQHGQRRRAERSVPPAPAAVAPHPTRSEPPAPRPAPRPTARPSQDGDRPVRMRASRAPKAARAEAAPRPSRRSGASARPSSRRSSSERTRATKRPPSEPKPVPPKVQANLDRARSLAGGLATSSHYDVLGIDKSADEKAIRLAFRSMAREFHVDRFARYGLDKDTLGAVQKVFVAANKAHEVLSSAEKRAEYDLSLEMAAGGSKVVASGGGPQLDKVFKAEKLIKDATVLIGRGKPESALERLEVAAPILPEDPVLKAAQVFAEHLVAQGQGGSQVMVRRAKETLEEICAELDNREEPFLYLGRIYRTLDESDKAIRAFETALKINPHFAEAGSELRHAQRKAEQSKQSGLAGLFGRRKK